MTQEKIVNLNLAGVERLPGLLTPGLLAARGLDGWLLFLPDLIFLAGLPLTPPLLPPGPLCPWLRFRAQVHAPLCVGVSDCVSS
jgi:hypothetical protein